MAEGRRTAAALALALGLLAAAPGRAGDPGPAEVLADAAGAVGLLSRPAATPGAPARHAAVLVVHDALGLDRRSEAYVRQLLGASLVVLEMELQPVSADGAGPGPTEPDRLPRALAALAGDPAVDPGRIGALGFGEGAQALALAGPVPAIAAQVLLYPGCGSLAAALAEASPADGARGPWLLMHGTADPANTTADCARLAGLLAETGLAVEVIAWAQAGYGWDIPQPGSAHRSWQPAPGGGPAVRVTAWPELSALAATRAAAFLAFALAPAGR